MRILNGLVVSGLFALTPFAFADVVHLKNGRAIECIAAWEEGSTVKYRTAGGVVMIPKSMVIKIEKTQPQTPAQKAEPQLPKELQRSEKKSADSANTIAVLEKKDRSDPNVRYQLGLAYTDAGLDLVEKKDFTAALESFQKAYQTSRNEDTAFNLAAIHYTLKDDWYAERYFQEVVKLNPKNAKAFYYLGEIAWRKEELEEAQSYWQKAYQHNPDPEIKARLDSLLKEKKAAEAYEKDTSSHFLIRYDGGVADAVLVQEISGFLEEVYQDLSNRFEAYPTDPFIVVLYPRETFFDVTDMPAWSGGANDGKIKLPVKGLTSVNEKLKSVLTHELTHSFVRYKTSDNYPIWLQEGLAQYFEGKRSGTNETAALSRLIESNRLPSLQQLSGSFLGANTQTAAILYAYSLAFTEYLLERYSFSPMNELLDTLGKGTSFEEAVENAYQVQLAELEGSWRNEINTD